MRKKKRFFACAILMIMVSLLCQTTFAYFTASVTVENTITTGGIDVELHQKTSDGKNVSNLDGIMPGAAVSRIVTVENKQDDAYVRVKVDVTVYDKEGKEMNLSEAELNKLLSIDYNTENWTKKDGLWYYNAPMTKGAVTEPLCTQILMAAESMTNEYQFITVSLSIQAQATQVANNGTNSLDAAGWPEF